MKSIIKYTAVVLVVLSVSTKSMAQHALEFTAAYNVNIPVSGFKDYITNPAYKGFTGGLYYPFNNQFKLGLTVGYNDYYQKYPRQVYEQDKTSAVSAVLSNSIQQMPVLISANYTLTKSGFIRPYIGAAGGVNFISFDQYLGEFDSPQSMVKTLVQGEAGVLIPLSKSSPTALKIGANYNYAPFKTYGTDNLNSWGILAGIRVALH
jgi:hypothetical protein